jgi:hypothetical protein
LWRYDGRLGPFQSLYDAGRALDMARTIDPVAASDLVVEPGDRVRTWGQFVANSAGDWLDLARIDNLLPHPPGWTSGWSIRVVGVDAEQVPTDFAANRNISVVGTWREDSIEVELQSPEIPSPKRFHIGQIHHASRRLVAGRAARPRTRGLSIWEALNRPERLSPA